MNILYEDNHIIVVEKPANIPVQADSSGDMDLLSMLKAYVKEKYNKPGEVYLGLVHRLDRPVAGIMVFARTSKAAARLSDQIRNGQLEKIYLAVGKGVPAKNKGRLIDHLLKDTDTNTVRVVQSFVPGAKEAVLDYEVLGVKDSMSLFKVHLHTGRAHQIRVQLAHNGTPLYGDRKYGHKSDRGDIALYAAKLSFNHPVKREKMTFVGRPAADQVPWDKFDLNIR